LEFRESIETDLILWSGCNVIFQIPVAFLRFPNFKITLIRYMWARKSQNIAENLLVQRQNIHLMTIPELRMVQ
jgi:hypothetical protein